MKHAVLHLNLGVLFSSRLFPGLKRANIAVILIGIVLILIVDILKENDRWESVKAKSPMLVRNFAYTFLIIMSILFAAGGNELTKGFMYANF